MRKNIWRVFVFFIIALSLHTISIGSAFDCCENPNQQYGHDDICWNWVCLNCGAHWPDTCQDVPVVTNVEVTKYTLGEVDITVAGENAPSVKVAVWSTENGQDDIAWYEIKEDTDVGAFEETVSVDLTPHIANGEQEFSVEIYFSKTSYASTRTVTSEHLVYWKTDTEVPTAPTLLGDPYRYYKYSDLVEPAGAFLVMAKPGTDNVDDPVQAYLWVSTDGGKTWNYGDYQQVKMVWDSDKNCYTYFVDVDSSEATYTCLVRSMDSMENWDVSSEYEVQQVVIDNTPPMVETPIESQCMYTAEPNYVVSLEAKDEGGAGVDNVMWRVYDPNGNDLGVIESTENSGNTYSLNYQFGNEGKYTFEPRVIDKANNIYYLSSDAIKIEVVHDTLPPSGSAEFDEYTTDGNLLVNARATDVLSQIKEIKYEIIAEDTTILDTGVIVENATSGSNYIDFRNYGEGIYTVCVYAVDKVGNSALIAEKEVAYLEEVAVEFEWTVAGGEEVFFDSLFTTDNVVSWGDGTITKYIAGQNQIEHTYSVNGTYTVQVFHDGIVTLSVANKGITSLDVSGATALEGLYCYDNEIDSLTVSGNVALKELIAYGNENITINCGNIGIEKIFAPMASSGSINVQSDTAKINYVDVVEENGKKYGRIIYSNGVFNIVPNEDGILERIVVNEADIGTSNTTYVFSSGANGVWLQAVFSHSDTLQSFTANAPVLSEAMIPVKYVDDKWVETNEYDVEWYNYENGKWANMMLADGSMFVWIPRYTYKINSENNTIDIKWSQGKVDDTSGGYLRHPAFYLGEYTGGNPNANSSFSGRTGNLNELNGFWMAKYMASKNESGLIQSKPNQAPITVNGVNDAFEKAMKLKENNDVYHINETGVFTHLTKNSEWGAVAYLATAKGFIPRENTTNATGNDKSITQSSTKNVYGVFDLNGPIAEYTAGFIPDAVSQNNAPSLNISYNKDYVDKFTKSLGQYYGVSMTEIKDSTGNNIVPNESMPFVLRGSGDIGLYGYKNADGLETTYGFRPVITVDNDYMAGELALFETEASVIAGDYLIITVDFMVKRPWKFDLAAGETLKEKLFEFIDLKFVQTGNSSSGNTIELYQTTLNPELLEMSGSNTGLIDLDNNFVNSFNADEKYMFKIRVGGYADEAKEHPIFINIKDMTSKIIVEELRLVDSENDNDLKIEGYPYDKIRLSVFNTSGEYNELESVGLISVPVKTEYYLDELIDVTGGVLQLNYNGGLSTGTIDLMAANIVNYDTITATPGVKEQIPMVFEGKEVLQGDEYQTFNITVLNKRKYDVEIEKVVTPDKGDIYGTVDGAGSYENGTAVTLRAFGLNGYKFKGWTSNDIVIEDGTKTELKFVQPESDVKVTANFVGVKELSVVVPPTTEFVKKDPFTLEPMKLLALYEDGTTEYVTATTPGIKTNVAIGEILDSDEDIDIKVEYGGEEFEYTIEIVNRKYPLILAINDANAGAIRDENNSIKVPYNGRNSVEEYISYDTVLSYVAEPSPGYEFAGWDISVEGLISESDKLSPSISFVMPESNVTLTANFVLLEYTLKYVTTEGGVILGETEQILKKGYDGSVVEAIANEGYYFYGWDDGNKNNVRQDVNITEDKTYTAIFYEGFEVSFYGYDDIQIGQTQIVQAGESAVAPDASKVPVKDGYVFTGQWSEDYTNVQSNLIVYAIYDIATYEVSILYDANAGDVTGEGIYELDSLVELSVTNTNPNYQFREWKLLKEDGTDVTAELYPKEATEIILHFNMPPYNVEAQAIFDSTVVVGIQVNGVIVYSHFVVGSDLTIKTESDARYDFSQWLENSGLFTESEKVMREISVKVPSTMTIINADYTSNVPIYYTIVTPGVEHGNISVKIKDGEAATAESHSVLMGSPMEVIFTPDEGYKLSELKINNYALEEPETIPSILFDYVNMDMIIEASFSLI